LKNPTECVKNLRMLLKKLPAAAPLEFPDRADPMAVLVFSFLLWESTMEQALAAYEQLMDHIVDFNDLRVCMACETAEFLGARCPLAEERSRRLRAALRDIYLREHTVDLERLKTLGKREVRRELKTLDGMVPYVASRIMLLCFDTHAIPVDEQLRSHLAEVGAVDEEADVAEVSVWLSRQIRASAGLATHFALQAWVDGLAVRASRRGGGRRRTIRAGVSGKPSLRGVADAGPESASG